MVNMVNMVIVIYFDHPISSSITMRLTVLWSFHKIIFVGFFISPFLFWSIASENSDGNAKI